MLYFTLRANFLKKKEVSVAAADFLQREVRLGKISDGNGRKKNSPACESRGKNNGKSGSWQEKNQSPSQSCEVPHSFRKPNFSRSYYEQNGFAVLTRKNAKKVVFPH